MKLFHVSEEADIEKFIPRIPSRKDIDQSRGLVWALNEPCLPNYLTPRDCPRLAYHATVKTTQDDIAKFFSSSQRHCVVIESAWYERMAKTSLYIYEFDTADFQRQNANFRLQDDVAGYYISEQTQTPISVTRIDDLFAELFRRNVEVRILDNLWHLGRSLQQSTLNWSLCRMAHAQAELVRNR